MPPTACNIQPSMMSHDLRFHFLLLKRIAYWYVD